ncbi:hypothetical protein [Vibrio ezurae]|uniref:Uncharacterized protein n=1 Tax=Vibrio ezurae NBRC 102218 TaxID=1219080 RepID=U3CLU9_9VIBR|nr:hypothetical protein [Vibrio ezurae]GAD79168.1 hypothetical protein VEZ01S_08_02040 [Vibrio ezurae NBRC 102218]
MHNQSRIEVWYKAGTDQVLLGEVENYDLVNLFGMWRNVSVLNRAKLNKEPMQSANYRLKLYDDDGHLIGRKDVCESDAEHILGSHHWMLRQSRNRFEHSEALYRWIPVTSE